MSWKLVMRMTPTTTQIGPYILDGVAGFRSQEIIVGEWLPYLQ